MYMAKLSMNSCSTPRIRTRQSTTSPARPPLADLATRWTSAAVFNDKIYCSPGAGSHVLVIDPATDTLSSIDISKIDTRISCDGAVVEA